RCRAPRRTLSPALRRAAAESRRLRMWTAAAVSSLLLSGRVRAGPKSACEASRLRRWRRRFQREDSTQRVARMRQIGVIPTVATDVELASIEILRLRLDDAAFV